MRSINLERKESDILNIINYEKRIKKLEDDIKAGQLLLSTIRKDNAGKFKNFRYYCYNMKNRTGFDILGYIYENIDKSEDDILNGLIDELDSYKNWTD